MMVTIHVLSRNYYSTSYPPCKSIHVCQSNCGSICTVQGLPLHPSPLVRVFEYARVQYVCVLSRDSTLPHTLLMGVSAYARVTPTVVQGLSLYPSIRLVRVFVYVRVSFAVCVLFREHPNPLVRVSAYATEILRVHVLSRDYHSTVQEIMHYIYIYIYVFMQVINSWTLCNILLKRTGIRTPCFVGYILQNYLSSP